MIKGPILYLFFLQCFTLDFRCSQPKHCIKLDTEPLFKGVTDAHLEPSDIPYSPNQFQGYFLQQDGSRSF